MNTWRSWTLAGLVVALCTMMFAYIRARPLISDDHLSDVRGEVARIRAVLDEVECRRPAVAASDAAMPLADLLRLNGPFAECWEAARCSDLPEELMRQV